MGRARDGPNDTVPAQGRWNGTRHEQNRAKPPSETVLEREAQRAQEPAGADRVNRTPQELEDRRRIGRAATAAFRLSIGAPRQPDRTKSPSRSKAARHAEYLCRKARLSG